MRILYVEDNPANLSLMQRIARMGGHEVVSYTDGETALDNFAHDLPDLVLLDVQLAGTLTGVDVVQKLRERGVKLPVIAVTAYAMVGDKERFLAAGFDGYLSKPLPVTELVEMVQKYDLQRRTAPSAEAVPVAISAAATVEMPVQVVSSAPVVMPTEPTPAPPPADTGEASTTQSDRKKLFGDIDLAALARKKD